MPHPDDEGFIWNQEHNPFGPGSPHNDVLALRFPHLMRAQGGVDPQEAIVALLDKIVELEAQIDEAGRDTSTR